VDGGRAINVGEALVVTGVAAWAGVGLECVLGVRSCFFSMWHNVILQSILSVTNTYESLNKGLPRGSRPLLQN